MEKKKFLVDVPVRVNIWIRPESQRRPFEVLRQARPSVMFFISDGGRNEKEWEAIRQNRAVFENEIDWECTVYKIFEDTNNGLYAMGRKGAALIWSKVDRCIFLEDDQLPSVSYFQYCAELLEKYKDDTRIVSICAMNYAGVWEPANSDYFFAERGPIWGQATWKRSYEQRDMELNYGKDPYVMALLRKNLKKDKNILVDIEGYAKNPRHGGHIPGTEFLNRMLVCSQHQLYIIPKYNMMCNIGCTEEGTHSSEYRLLPRAIKGLFNMKTYECDFPLKHANYVIADGDYKNLEEKVLCRNRPVAIWFRKLEALMLAIRYQGIGKMMTRIKKHIHRRKITEN